ncbi:hypothetical protein LCGC14_1887640 [marine sediment metagenome]|uniref:Uncharacterized protein n=1 Tax=marine sediment metagenome TaxID=412755 RepID=A0A0F9IE96_9ZZZZ
MNIIRRHKLKIQDKAGIRGRVAWTVFEHTPFGLHKLMHLKERFLNGEITKEVRDKLRRIILDDPKMSSVKQYGESCSRERLLKRGFVNNMRWALGFNHNIVTNQGDALIADLLAETPARTKVDNTNGFVAVGTGWTGASPKTNEAVNTPSGIPEGMEATYPKVEGAFGAANDNVIQYRVVFEAGDLNATINEAGLGNNATEASGDNLAYAEVSPNAVVSASDTLQVDWEITPLGA